MILVELYKNNKKRLKGDKVKMWKCTKAKKKKQKHKKKIYICMSATPFRVYMR